jgi:purine-binding chemotaxis protein CheW
MNAMTGIHVGATPLQVLTLSLHSETFALDALKVREILDPVPVTEVPGAPHFLNGLINVRGKVVPLLDLCGKLGMPPSSQSIDTRIIVVEVPIGGLSTIVGLRADKVYEMTELAAEALEDAPHIGMRVQSSFVRCIGKRSGEFLVVLDLEAILHMAPGQADVTKLRRHGRLKVALPCRVDIGGQTVAAQLADLSEGGAAIIGFPSRPQLSEGQIAIEGAAEELSFAVVDYQGGTLRVKFHDPGHPAVLELLRQLEEETDREA